MEITMTTITIKITELAGNHVDGFLSAKYGDALQSRISASVATEYSDAEIDVTVDTRYRTSGCTPAPIIAITGGDEFEITQRVEFIVETECRIFGERCMQDAEYFAE